MIAQSSTGQRRVFRNMEISVDEQLRILQSSFDNLDLELYLVRVDSITTLQRYVSQVRTTSALQRSHELLQKALEDSRRENAELANEYQCVRRQNELERDISEVLRARLDDVRPDFTYDVGSV